ncbi:hypothetical protein, partial [Vibrio azureus]
MTIKKSIVCTFLSMLIFGCSNDEEIGGSVLIFNEKEQALEIKDITTKIKKFSFPVLENISQPIIIQGNNDFISLTEGYGKDEHVIDLNSGKVSYNKNTIASVVISDESRFFFEDADPPRQYLFFQSGENLKKLTTITNSSAVSGDIIGNSYVSWYIPREMRMIIYTFSGQLVDDFTLDCTDAIYLGNGKTFCLRSSSPSIIYDVHNKLEEVIDLDFTGHHILSLSKDKNVVFFMVTSLSFDKGSFLSEMLDIYSYN